MSEKNKKLSKFERSVGDVSGIKRGQNQLATGFEGISNIF